MRRLLALALAGCGAPAPVSDWERQQGPKLAAEQPVTLPPLPEERNLVGFDLIATWRWRARRRARLARHPASRRSRRAVLARAPYFCPRNIPVHTAREALQALRGRGHSLLKQN